MGADLARQLRPNERGDERKKSVKRLTDKLEMSVTKGEVETLSDVVLSSGSNDEKVAVILGARGKYLDTPQQFGSWLREATRRGIVSKDVNDKVMRRLRQPATVH